MRHSRLVSAVAAVVAIYLVGRVLLIAAVWMAAFDIALAVLMVPLLTGVWRAAPRAFASPPKDGLVNARHAQPHRPGRTR